MENRLTDWVKSQPEMKEFHPKNWGKALSSNLELPKLFTGPTTNKLIGAKLQHFKHGGIDLNNTFILGGTCLLSRADMKRISAKQIVFNSLHEFECWLLSWYPRIDQIHDTVGIPPKSCKKIFYVVEDSFFSERLARQTGFNRVEIEKILRNAHKIQGSKVLKNWLRCFGYRGDVDVIYTSQIDRDLNLTLKVWERLLGFQFRACDNEFAKVEMMYTGFWLDILGISTSAVIYEPASKFVTKGWIHTQPWLDENQYGAEGVNKNLGIAGYAPFISSGKELGTIVYDEVPNYSNFKSFDISDENLLWYITNFLFPKRILCENGPSILDSNTAKTAIMSDLKQFYSI